MSGNAQGSPDHDRATESKFKYRFLRFREICLAVSLLFLVFSFIFDLIDICLVFIAEAPPSATKSKMGLELFYVTGFVFQLIGFVNSWTPALEEGVKKETTSPESVNSSQDSESKPGEDVRPPFNVPATNTNTNQQPNTDQGSINQPLLGATNEPPVKKSPRRCCGSAPWTAFWVFLTYLIVYALHIVCVIELQGYRPMNYFMV